MVPYLLQIDILVSEKVKELVRYQACMNRGQTQARSVSQSFTRIFRSLSSLKKKILDYHGSELSGLNLTIIELETEVRDLTERIREVAKILLLVKPTWRKLATENSNLWRLLMIRCAWLKSERLSRS